MNRQVPLHSLTVHCYHEDHSDDCHRPQICLIEKKMYHIYKDQQISLWIVTRPEPTNKLDGTIYMVVRDKSDFHIRLIISNWSYIIPTNELKSSKTLSCILDELLSVDSMIHLFEPLLTTCTIDDQPSLRCDAPNTELILSDRMNKCFVLDKLDDLRDRGGNQAYIRGDIQIALDYYTFAINRMTATPEMTMSHDNDFEMNLFRNAFQRDLTRLHSNRSACYLRERLYTGATLDALFIVTDCFCNPNYDEIFLKSLYRLICANIGSQEFIFALDALLNLAENSSLNCNLRMKYSIDFNQIQSVLPRFKEEYHDEDYDLKQTFKNESIDQTTLFHIHMFHSNFQNGLYIKKRNNSLYAKCLNSAWYFTCCSTCFCFC